MPLVVTEREVWQVEGPVALLRLVGSGGSQGFDRTEAQRRLQEKWGLVVLLGR